MNIMRSNERRTSSSLDRSDLYLIIKIKLYIFITICQIEIFKLLNIYKNFVTSQYILKILFSLSYPPY